MRIVVFYNFLSRFAYNLSLLCGMELCLDEPFLVEFTILIPFISLRKLVYKS